MKITVSKICYVIGIVMVPVSILISVYPILFNEIDGTIDVNWAAPVGIKMDRLSKGDRFDIDYSSEINVSLYLLTSRQANQYRSPFFYKEPLPEPISVGDQGSIEVVINESGDYELLFLPNEPSMTFTVEYELQRSIFRERIMFILSGAGLLLTSLIFIVLGFVLGRRDEKHVICK
ncbi:MAG: hypothetical protein ACMUFK_02820 [Thermoplasmatota archaeon]